MVCEYPCTELFQIRTVSSPDPETIVLPSGDTQTLWTGPLCPTKRKGEMPDLKFQTITVPSSDPETTWFKRGLNLVQLTAYLCPLNERLRAGSDRVSPPNSTYLSTTRFSLAS